MNQLQYQWLIAPVITLAASHACATQYLTVEQAQRLMFPDAIQFDVRPLRLTAEQKRSIESSSGTRVRRLEQSVWLARATDKTLGWFFVDEVYGKHEFITYALALEPDGAVKQLEVMDYREAYGHEVRNPDWRNQFVRKTRTDTLKIDADIRNITGATLSCSHITDGVRRLLAVHALALR
jgi:hypothetical protein